jgi:hypothetical protein
VHPGSSLLRPQGSEFARDSLKEDGDLHGANASRHRRVIRIRRDGSGIDIPQHDQRVAGDGREAYVNDDAMPRIERARPQEPWNACRTYNSIALAVQTEIII